MICGGTMDTDNKNLNPDPTITKAILERCYELCPELTHHKGVDAFDIVSINVGFRPGRKGGIRIEKEVRGKEKRESYKLVVHCVYCVRDKVSAATGEAVTVIHNYGHSSHGKYTGKQRKAHGKLTNP